MRIERQVNRDPYSRGRIIGVSRAAARELDMIDDDAAMVSVVRQQSTFPQLQIRSGETCENQTRSVGTNRLLERRPPKLHNIWRT